MGRAKGSKDKVKRVRRTKKQMAETQPPVEVKEPSQEAISTEREEK